MHQEFSLYGKIPDDKYNVMLQQLTGVARMQPKYVKELHLVFKANVPPGLRLIPSATNSDRIQNPEVQRVSKMLTNNIYYVQLVGAIEETSEVQPDGDVLMSNGGSRNEGSRRLQWELEFKDTPDPGKQTVTSRHVSRTPISGGDVMAFMKAFGFEYVTRYLIEGAQFYDQNTTLFLYRASEIPAARNAAPTDISFLDSIEDARLLDQSGSYILQASAEAVDGSTAELKDRATRQLMAVKETHKQAVDLTPGDRLALDTKISTRSR